MEERAGAVRAALQAQKVRALLGRAQLQRETLRPKVIARASREFGSDLSACNAAYAIEGGGINAHPPTVQRWIERYAGV